MDHNFFFNAYISDDLDFYVPVVKQYHNSHEVGQWKGVDLFSWGCMPQVELAL